MTSLQRIRGFSLAEVIVACGVMVFGVFVFFSVFSSSSHHATQTQNRTIAHMMAESYLEEFKAHPYGDEIPKHWEEKVEQPVTMFIKSRAKKMTFHKLIEFENGSFVGKSQGNQDKVTLIITWEENVGSKEIVGDPTGFPKDNKWVRVQVPVWR